MNIVADPGYWKSLEELVAKSRMVIDRPKGSRHPRFPEMTYPLDYGFLEDTTGNDGAEADIWRGAAGTSVTGVVCTVDLMKKDAEVKILIGCNAEEIATIHAFYNTGAYMNAITVVR